MPITRQQDRNRKMADRQIGKDSKKKTKVQKGSVMDGRRYGQNGEMD